MKFNLKTFTLTNVNFQTKAYMILFPLFGMIVSIAMANPETPPKIKKNNFELPNVQKSEKLVNRKDANNIKNVSKRPSITDDLEWDETSVDQSSNFTAVETNLPTKDNRHNPFTENKEHKTNESDSTYNKEELKNIEALLENLEKEQSSKKNTNPSSSQVSNNLKAHNRSTQNLTKPRRKKRIFSEGRGKIIASNIETYSDSRIRSSNNSSLLSSNRNNSSYTEDIKVKVHGNYEKLTDKSKITVRTTEVAYITGHKIPIGTFLSGVTSFNNNRLNIHFTALYLDESIIPVRFKAYSLDGLEGIFIEGGIPDNDRKDIKTDVVDETINEVPINIPIIGGAIRALAKRKNHRNRVFVHLPSNYPLILKNKK